VAHDFNNLLTAIMGYGEMVNDTLEPGSASQGDMGQVLCAARRAEVLTRQLLMFSRRQRSWSDLFDLSSAMRELEPLLRRLISGEIEIALPTASCTALVQADRGQIELVIMTLAANARDAMPHGGRLSIGVMVESNDVEGSDTSARVRLTVSDTGFGIAPELLTRIFEPFFTTKAGGAGLGLATAQEILTQNGGHLEVESEPGCGTTFTLFLNGPAADAGDTEPPALPVRIEVVRARHDA
jgi:two-component system cell cycle sensor histidine kinase/response regulator CckA